MRLNEVARIGRDNMLIRVNQHVQDKAKPRLPRRVHHILMDGIVFKTALRSVFVGDKDGIVVV